MYYLEFDFEPLQNLLDTEQDAHLQLEHPLDLHLSHLNNLYLS